MTQRTICFLILALLPIADAMAQTETWRGERETIRTLKGLLGEGYEIRAAASSSGREIVYVQKGNSGFRCIAAYDTPSPALTGTLNPFSCAEIVEPVKR